MAKVWSGRGNSHDLELDGVEHSQFVRNAVWDIEQTYDGDGADAPEPDVPFEPFDGPVAAKGGIKGGGGRGGGDKSGGGGSSPTNITLDNQSVDENSIGGTVIGTLDAADADKKERFTFTLADDAHGLFAISGKNKLVVADGANLDYETAKMCQITVRVTDKQGNTFDKIIDISINNLTEAPNTAPSAMQLSDNSIPEGSANGALVGVLTTTDLDANETFTYTLTDSAEGRFVIDGDRIEIADSSLIDFETATSHSVTVQVTDSAGHIFDKTFTIQIEDTTGLAEQPD